MAKSSPPLAIYTMAEHNTSQPLTYPLLMNQKRTINPYLRNHFTLIILLSLQPAIPTIIPYHRLILNQRIRITNPIAITPIMRGREIITRTRTNAIFKRVYPDAHEIAVGSVGIAVEVEGRIADDGFVGRG